MTWLEKKKKYIEALETLRDYAENQKQKHEHNRKHVHQEGKRLIELQQTPMGFQSTRMQRIADYNEEFKYLGYLIKVEQAAVDSYQYRIDQEEKKILTGPPDAS